MQVRTRIGGRWRRGSGYRWLVNARERNFDKGTYQLAGLPAHLTHKVYQSDHPLMPRIYRTIMLPLPLNLNKLVRAESIVIPKYKCNL